MFWSWRSAPRGSQLLPSRGLLIDLFGAGRLAVGLGAVALARLTAGFLGVRFGLALGEGPCLALAGTQGRVELTAEALVLGLQVVDPSLKGLAVGTPARFHTRIMRGSGTHSCTDGRRGIAQFELGTLIKYLTATWPACDRMAARSSAIPGVSSQDSASLNRISQTKSSRRARGKSCHAPGQRRGGEGLFHGSPRRRTATADCPPARGPQAFASAFTVTTGQGAVRRTCSATLPISTRPSPVRPCVPITIRSHRVSWAAPTIRGAASPFSTR